MSTISDIVVPIVTGSFFTLSVYYSTVRITSHDMPLVHLEKGMVYTTLQVIAWLFGPYMEFWHWQQ